MKIGCIAACFAGAVAVSPSAAPAALLIYTETADVSGSLNGVSFTDNVLTLEAIGDTSSVSVGPGGFFLDAAPLTFTLSGGGSGTFTDETGLMDNQAARIAGFADFTTTLGILYTTSTAFATYDLRTVIGPETGGAVFNPGFSFATSAGALVIEGIPLRFTATFTAATVPEPSTWAMLLLGFAGLGFAGYRTARKGVSIAA